MDLQKMKVTKMEKRMMILEHWEKQKSWEKVMDFQRKMEIKMEIQMARLKNLVRETGKLMRTKIRKAIQMAKQRKTEKAMGEQTMKEKVMHWGTMKEKRMN